MSGFGRVPQIVPQPAPAAKTLHVTVWDVPGKGATIEAMALRFDDGTWPLLPGTISPLDPAQVTWTLPDSAQYGWHVQLLITARGGKQFTYDTGLFPNLDLQLPTPRRVLPRLVVRDKFFAYDDGVPATIIGCSDFPMYAYYLQGRDISPILKQRADLGFTMLRVWCLNTSVVRIVPSDYGDAFYARMPEFLQYVSLFGLYVQWTAFTQAKTLMPALEDQRRHIINIDEVCAAETNWIGEGVNEFNNVDNDISDALTEPVHGLWSHGSNTGDPGDNPPKAPTWSHSCIHSWSASGQFQRVVGHQCMEESDRTGKPCWANENARYGDMDHSVAHASDAAEAAALLGAGSLFHSWAGKLSTPFGQSGQRDAEFEGPCAAAWAAGAHKVDLSFQTGRYLHRGDLEPSGVLRAYARQLPDGRQYIATIRE